MDTTEGRERLMGAVAERDMVTSLDKIIFELDRAVESKVTLTPKLVADLRDLLVTVRECGLRLSAAEQEILDREPAVRLLRSGAHLSLVEH